MTEFCILAGEHSGDALGTALMEALKRQTSGNAAFYGVGGGKMLAAGLDSLFPMREIALMGFAEVLPHIPRLKRRIRESADMILTRRPDALITIDSPGFNYRVVRRLREAGFDRPCIHYVAPTVWAYKPGRAKKTAALFDRLLCLLPFEPPFFEAEGLPTDFVGHPVADIAPPSETRDAFRDRHHIATATPLLCLLPGSRRGERARLLPVYADMLALLTTRIAGLRLVMAVPADAVEEVSAATAAWAIPPLIVSAEADKQAMFHAADLALAKSGTVALEAAQAGLPMVTAYKVHPISAWLLRRMIRTPYVNLVNILLKRLIIPELLQEDCTPEKLCEALSALWLSGEAREAQRAACREAIAMLQAPDGRQASDVAADRILQHCLSDVRIRAHHQ